MENLPLEIYECIFEHLHLIDLARLRRVCKKIRIIVQEYRIRELFISHSDAYFAKTDDGIYQNSMIIQPRNFKRTLPCDILRSSPDDYNSLFNLSSICQTKSSSFQRFALSTIFLRRSYFNVQFLRSLSFFYSDRGGAYLRLEEVNRLVQLERLQMGFANQKVFNPNHLKLSLPNLKILLLGS